MAAHDPSWDIFRAELKRWMDIRHFTNKDLAAALNKDLAAAGLTIPVDEAIIKRWRHSTAPPLQALKVIARALRMSDESSERAAYDPTYLPRTMGILDAAPAKGEVIEAAYRLQTIRAQIADAQGALAASTADEGIVDIVRAATQAGLGCAILPVHEGPAGYPMHVSDRVDFRAPGGTTAPDMSEHPRLGDALHDAFAVRSRRFPRFCDDSGEPVARWAVPYLGRPRIRSLHTTHPRLPGIAINAVTTAGWIDDIGDIVAMVLGYGFTTTRELAHELVANPYTNPELRGSIHDSFLHDALPQGRVWTHYTQDDPTLHEFAPFRDRQGRVNSDLVQFFICEDDALLRHAAGLPAGGSDMPSPERVEATMKQLTSTRETLLTRAHEAAAGQHVHVVDAGYRETPEERWEQVFRCVLEILRTLESLGVEVHLAAQHERLQRTEPDVAPQVMRWLADHDAPFVSPALRTTR